MPSFVPVPADVQQENIRALEKLTDGEIECDLFLSGINGWYIDETTGRTVVLIGLDSQVDLENVLQRGSYVVEYSEAPSNNRGGHDVPHNGRTLSD